MDRSKEGRESVQSRLEQDSEVAGVPAQAVSEALKRLINNVIYIVRKYIFLYNYIVSSYVMLAKLCKEVQSISLPAWVAASALRICTADQGLHPGLGFLGAGHIRNIKSILVGGWLSSAQSASNQKRIYIIGYVFLFNDLFIYCQKYFVRFS